MVIVCFRAGTTTLACFQNSASVGRASGSTAMARRISRSVIERTRFQSVAGLAEALPIGFSFMALCPPRRDDSALLVGYIRVNHRDLDAIHNTNGIDSKLTVVEAVVRTLQRGPLEDPDGVLETDTMQRDILPALLRVPNISHADTYIMYVPL